MRQLGELKKNTEKFEQAGAEVIAVFREEQKGVEGLKLIKEKAGVDFTLALDTGKKLTGRYSPGPMEFSNFVIGKDGIVKEIVTGDLKNRAKSEQLLAAIKSSSPADGGDATPSKQKPESKKSG